MDATAVFHSETDLAVGCVTDFPIERESSHVAASCIDPRAGRQKLLKRAIVLVTAFDDE